MMTYEMKNFSKISIANDELIIEWDKGTGCATKIAFALSDIKAIGIDLKSEKGEDKIKQLKEALL